MMSQHYKAALMATAMSALFIFHGPARADDTADEIRLLKAQLRKLEEKVSEQARKQKETQVQIRAVAAQPAPQAPPPGSPYGNIGVAIAPLGGAPQQGLTATQSAVRGLPEVGSPSLYINGVSITPGGFLALESVFRNRFVGADIGTPYQNIPYYNNRVGYSNEFRFSARQSRASLLVQGNVSPTLHLAGYGEFDFLGAAQTANSNESNSFNLRIRHLYATADEDYFGAHLLAGQTWSLLTMNSKGIIPRKEDIPLSIDAQYVPGFAWARQPQIRLVKDFDQTFWAGISVENPQTTFGCSSTTSGAVVTNNCTTVSPYVAGVLPSSLTYNAPSVGGGLFNSVNTLSLNHVPDVIGKLAWDPNLGDRSIHMEGFGIFRDFYSQVYNNNQDVAGWGVGGSILVPVVPKTLDLQFSGMTGRGIGRYGSAQLPDVSFNWNGTISPLPETMLLAGAVWHALPQLDIYTYAGEEFQKPSYSNLVSSTGVVSVYGNGNPLYNNLGCSTEAATTTAVTPTCTGNIKLIRQFTAGFWDKLYDGPFGSLRAGLQYSFTQKYSFAGIGGAAKTEDSAFLTSLRYYPF
ncbi:hypothetical protein [Methylocapsa acidiphila]|uniref:hypothetical protein n=1 Tax=Methylocapsa acidiphila TaxID=133552 RepID=UPI0003FC7589|nr:hypothetical protein [Methylocapsa acidiphila]